MSGKRLLSPRFKGAWAEFVQASKQRRLKQVQKKSVTPRSNCRKPVTSSRDTSVDKVSTAGLRCPVHSWRYGTHKGNFE